MSADEGVGSTCCVLDHFFISGEQQLWLLPAWLLNLFLSEANQEVIMLLCCFVEVVSCGPLVCFVVLRRRNDMLRKNLSGMQQYYSTGTATCFLHIVGKFVEPIKQ